MFEKGIQEFDVIILGTDLKNCILSGLLSVAGKKVLHIDKNDFYGGDTASISPLPKITEIFPDAAARLMPKIQNYGNCRNYNIDLISKFLIADGQLVQMLIKTDVVRYLEFVMAEGSYVYQGKKIHKVPGTASEALSSPLLGFFEKNRFRNFLQWVSKWSLDDQKTWRYSSSKLFNPSHTTMQEIFDYFSLDKNTGDFVLHAICLYTDDSMRHKPYRESIERIQLYSRSLGKYNGTSPYLYTRYGLGELPQAFARLSAVYGGTYMLSSPVKKITYENDDAVNGCVTGIVLENGEVFTANMIIGSPAYFPDRVKVTSKILRSICLLNSPVPNTDNKQSLQIILPQSQLPGKNHNVYIAVSGPKQNVCQEGFYLANISTTVETDCPLGEIEAAINVLGRDRIEQQFTKIDPVYVPKQDYSAQQIFITESYDATSHFESACKDILRVWEAATGHPLDLSAELKCSLDMPGHSEY